jgi:maltodextrin utilization protein YvdJ
MHRTDNLVYITSITASFKKRKQLEFQCSVLVFLTACSDLPITQEVSALADPWPISDDMVVSNAELARIDLFVANHGFQDSIGQNISHRESSTNAI